MGGAVFLNSVEKRKISIFHYKLISSSPNWPEYFGLIFVQSHLVFRQRQSNSDRRKSAAVFSSYGAANTTVKLTDIDYLVQLLRWG
jgi:hypothetical protein